MAIPAAPPLEQESPGTSPFLIIIGTLLTVLLATVVIFSVGGSQGQDALTGGPGGVLAGPAPVGACGQGTPADPSYSVDLVASPDPPRPEGTTFLLTLRRDGKAVIGAKVCLTADMPDMQHPGINYVAKESSAGRYEARLQFGMGGNWRTSVTIAESDKPVVAVPLTIEVAQIEPS